MGTTNIPHDVVKEFKPARILIFLWFCLAICLFMEAGLFLFAFHNIPKQFAAVNTKPLEIAIIVANLCWIPGILWQALFIARGHLWITSKAIIYHDGIQRHTLLLDDLMCVTWDESEKPGRVAIETPTTRLTFCPTNFGFQDPAKREEFLLAIRDAIPPQIPSHQGRNLSRLLTSPSVQILFSVTACAIFLSLGTGLVVFSAYLAPKSDHYLSASACFFMAIAVPWWIHRSVRGCNRSVQPSQGPW